MPQNRKYVIANRRTRVAQLYLEGDPQHVIAEKVGCTQPQVSRDLKILSQQWKESALSDLDQIKSLELAKLNELERKYTLGWYRSIQVQTTKKRRKKDSDGGTETERSSEKKELVGDSKFLDGILKCIHRRAELLGLDAPRKKTIDANLNLEHLVDLLPEEALDLLLEKITQSNEKE